MTIKNRKKYFHPLLVCLLLAVAVFIAGCGSSSTGNKTTDETTKENKANNEQKSQTIVLKLSFPTPDTSFFGQGYDFFAKAVEEESKGQVKVEVHPAATLVADAEILDAIRKGNVDIGHFMGANVSPTIKELTPYEVPIGYPGDKYNEFVEATFPIVEKIFAKYGVKYLGQNATDIINFAGDATYKAPQDLKGKTVRTPGKWGGEAIKLWGGSPVAVPPGDLSVALERGTIDVLVTGTHGNFIVTGLAKPGLNVTIVNLQQMFTGLIMSEKAWNKLNEDQRQAVERASKRWMDFSYDLASKEKQNFAQTVEKAGATVYRLTEAENDEFKKAAGPIMNQVKAISGPEGEELIKVFEKMGLIN
ncbi:MAG: TRAP transporter substrate-binding protein [Thermincola sp.]|jgi:TRAP-type C4-dicarboxylate transport system substrate-binding protein|nr:TRAP transporter substrate-binding protein [Thermincola sp.]MDT3702820.1 TRAP transporter substrate-binding protein [Thermincola sp.]